MWIWKFSFSINMKSKRKKTNAYASSIQQHFFKMENYLLNWSKNSNATGRLKKGKIQINKKMEQFKIKNHLLKGYLYCVIYYSVY